MLKKVAHDLLQPINTTAIVILALLTLVWGLWVANPYWDAFSTAMLFSQMDNMGGEGFWGMIAILAGAAMMYGVLRPSYFTLAFGAASGYLFWLVVSAFYFIGDWHNTGGVVSVFLSLYCMFVWVNHTVNKDRFTNTTQ